MGERPTEKIEVIHPELEILPPDHAEPRSSAGGSAIWLSVDAHGGTQRITIARPGPFATFLLVLAFGVLLTVSFVVALALFSILVGVAALGLAGLLVYGLVRGVLKRLR
jgi:hypothetical protein